MVLTKQLTDETFCRHCDVSDEAACEKLCRRRDCEEAALADVLRTSWCLPDEVPDRKKKKNFLSKSRCVATFFKCRRYESRWYAISNQCDLKGAISLSKGISRIKETRKKRTKTRTSTKEDKTSHFRITGIPGFLCEHNGRYLVSKHGWSLRKQDLKGTI